ncbi:aldo/keto reductase [Streptomyces diastatochromogenes]|nr:aldo/keto reductase [Streptomyces diastatochromogenes]
MERRTIGATALGVGAIGLGCMPMSWAYSRSEQRGDRSLRTVHAALDAGVSLLDTADMYGPFTNELLVGRALKERRSEAFVSTKCGLLVGDGGERRHVVANGRPGYVRRACDASLRRLQTDVIDLYQLHRADPEVPVEETWGAMAELVSAGKVRALGLCAVGPARSGAGPIRTRERSANWTGSSRSSRWRRWRRSCRCGPRSRWRGSSLVRGAGRRLPRGHAAGERLPHRDADPGRRLRAGRPAGPAPRFTAEMMAANQPIVAGLRRVAARHGAGVTPAQVALAWVLGLGRHVVPVPGAKRERWAVENARAASLRLTAEDLAEIAALPAPRGSWD